MKRLIDILGSIIGLIILLPFFPFIALAITINSNCNINISKDRVSKGRVIKVYKFRSMVVGAAEKKKELLDMNERKDGPFFKIKNDPRITKIGKFLRKTRIDEFPQLINVLKGELSLVGPRPHEPGELYLYPREYRVLLAAKTGITGLSQVSGASGLPFLKELELDRYYLDNQSLWLDIKILLKTLFIFFTDPTGV
ncbi:MAG: sugar transferase [Patescibacteria group bacterium]|nr:sugar transferase [Patescibacteria group bacterium]